MSEFLFGDFFIASLEKKKVRELKDNFAQKDVYIWFDDEIDFYKEIHTMLKEHPGLKRNHSFAITTKIQKGNSHDLLYPWDKYNISQMSNDDCYNEKSEDELYNINLAIFYDLFNEFIKIIRPIDMRVFVVDSYDPEFEIVKLSLKEMFLDLKENVKENDFIVPTIYEIV